MTERTDHRIALFIDFENLVTNTGISPASFDLTEPLDRLLERGKVVFRRAYCDWSRFREATRHLHELGVELIDVPPSTRAGKNAADMRLVIDSLELCYARGHIDTFVIASGDSDFCPLAYKLRENDKSVIGLAAKNSTSPLFVKACDEFIYLTNAEGRHPERGGGSSGGGGSGGASRRGRGGRGRGGRSRVESPAKDTKSPGEVPRIVREVVESLLARATGPINPSFIKETVVRREPDFDEREHGFSSFIKLLGEMEEQGLLRRQLVNGRQWYVVPADAPVET